MSDSTAALERARAAALEELRRAPVTPSWRRSAALFAAALVLTILATVLVALATSLIDVDHFISRAPWLAALAVFGALASLAAIAPRAGAARPTLVAVGLGLMAVLVASRGAGPPSTVPGWVCSASHLGLDLLPLGVAMVVLRQAAWQWSRAVVAGLAAGSAGALLGELACHQGARHALVHHVGAWLLATAACVVISRWLRPRTFAP